MHNKFQRNQQIEESKAKKKLQNYILTKHINLNPEAQ